MPTFVSWAATAAFSWIALVAASAAPDSFFRADDVVAIVGGEDSVVLRDDPVFLTRQRVNDVAGQGLSKS